MQHIKTLLILCILTVFLPIPVHALSQAEREELKALFNSLSPEQKARLANLTDEELTPPQFRKNFKPNPKPSTKDKKTN